MGIELNSDKRQPPCTSTRHLGFTIDLKHKMISITLKHKRKIFNLFDKFMVSVRKKGRISLKDIQRMLGLQIWISSVFRAARQFLTSTCDVLQLILSRGSRSHRFFFPRKHPALTSRFIFDLKFWRRFVKETPQASFAFITGTLPRNDCTLFSDASSLFGMGGVLLFGDAQKRIQGVDGLF